MDIINEFHKAHRKDELIRDRWSRTPIPNKSPGNSGLRRAAATRRLVDSGECGFESRPVH